MKLGAINQVLRRLRRRESDSSFVGTVGIVAAPSQTLKVPILMYATRWGLEKVPFPSGAAEPVFFAGLPQQESLARMRFLVQNQRRLGLMLGESGWGKSLVLRMFAEECRSETWHVAKLNLLGLSLRDFQWQLALELGACPRSSDEPFTLARRVEVRLLQDRVQQQSTVLLLDDVDQAGPDVLTQILRLLQSSRVGDITIILAARNSQATRLGPRLLDLIDLRIDLEPWDADDTIGFVQSALIAAGAEQPIFDDTALEAIHTLTGGVPRLVTRLADYSLVVGAGEASIGNEIVQAAWEGINQL